MAPYSIQWLMRCKPAWFRHDLLTLPELLKQGKIKPLIAQRGSRDVWIYPCRHRGSIFKSVGHFYQRVARRRN
jgi:hypothetical protein